MHIYLVCYDIEDDRIRRKTAQLLERYGERVQHSVFEVSFYKHRGVTKATMIKELQQIVKEPNNIRLYRLTKDAYNDSSTLDGKPLAVEAPYEIFE